MLLISTDNSKLYSFTLSKIFVFEIEVDRKVNLKFNKLYWSNDGKYFILEDKSNFIIGSPIIENENVEYEEAENINENENENGETFNGKVGTWFQPFNSELSIQFHSPYRSGFSE